MTRRTRACERPRLAPGPAAAAGYYPWFGNLRPTSAPRPASIMPSAIMYASAADLAQLLALSTLIAAGWGIARTVLATRSLT